MNSTRRSKGFTLIEIIIVVVIIGILTTISIVSYSGITDRANADSLKSDLVNASDFLRVDQAQSSKGWFPDTLALGNGGLGITASKGTTLTYNVNNINTPKTFCLTATKSAQSYNINQEGIPFAGPCPVLWLDAGITTSYPGTGTTWNDLSGNGNNGTLVNGAAYSNTNGGVLSFDGGSGYVDTGMTNNFSQFSVSVWFYPTLFSGERGIVTKYVSGFGNGNWTLELSGSNLLWDINDGAQKLYQFPLTINTWYHAVGIYDSTGGTNNGKLYVNGLLRGVFSANAMALNSDRINIGRARTGLFNGYISNARIYDRALSANDINQNFNALRSRYGI